MPYTEGMATPVLATKLYRPHPRPSVVRRPRLLSQLHAGLDDPLTLLSAPAGFGKTTLLADGLAEGPYGVAWLSLEEADSDPYRFLLYLVAALQMVVPACDAVLGLLVAPQPPPVEVVLTRLINTLAAEEQGEVVLVLDDYHRAAGPGVDQVLTFLLEHLAPRLHLVVATREDPGLPLARLRARGQLVELRQVALSFTEEETAEFLRKGLGLTLSSEQLGIIAARTEGWIAGVPSCCWLCGW